MEYLKRIGISLSIILISIFSFSFLVSLLYYFKLLSSSTLAILKIIIPMISVIIGGIIIGRKSLKKGWLEGLKLSLFFLVLLTLFNFLALNTKWEMKLLLYDGIIMISSILGSMIGINLTKEK